MKDLKQCSEYEHCELRCRKKERYLKQMWFGEWITGESNNPSCPDYEPPLEELFI